MTELFYSQMQKRKTLDKIPIQANFYPLPSMAFLQDKSTRLTLLSSQPNGVASLHQGNHNNILLLERFSNDCRKTKTKAITSTNHNRNEQRDEPITIPSNHL